VIFGLLNIDKPSGPTSHDIVAQVRRGVGEKRVGHAGTLDPLASGVLIVALGQATRLVEYLQASHKTYQAQITLGVATDTYDAEGDVIISRPVPDDLSEAYIDHVLEQFRGEIMQTPPVYSAIKVGGKSAHARVRAGQEVELQPRPLTIHNLTIDSFQPPLLNITVICSPGTYIRSLAHDIGTSLGTGAMLSGLVRTASGTFRRDDAVSWENLRATFADGTWARYLIPADRALPDAHSVTVDAIQVERIADGKPLPSDTVPSGMGRALTASGDFVAVLEADSIAKVWRPVKVFPDVIQHWRERQSSSS
jgi:tRNA pseudouridine55 synthase